MITVNVVYYYNNVLVYRYNDIILTTSKLTTITTVHGVVPTDREPTTAGTDPLYQEHLDREHGVASCQLVCV